MLRAALRAALFGVPLVRRCELPPARDDVRCVAVARREAPRSWRAFDFPARVSRDDSRVGDALRLRPAVEVRRLVETEVARLRVTTPFARVAALARCGFSRVCWMLRLVMRPVRRALWLGARRDFDEEDRFDFDFAGIVFPLVSE